MKTPRIATSYETITAMLDRSKRRAVPIRRSFVRADVTGARPGLGEMVRRHDARALDLYLLVLAQASGGKFDVTHPAAVWARALDLDGDIGNAAVSKTLARLVAYRLLARDRVGRQSHLSLLREDGTGDPYTHPGAVKDAYLQLPHAYWTDTWHAQLMLPAKAALLIARSLPPRFFLNIESAPKQYALSADTLADGLQELVKHRLLERLIRHHIDPLSALGYKKEYTYRLLPPFQKRASQTPTSSAPPAPTGTP